MDMRVLLRGVVAAFVVVSGMWMSPATVAADNTSNMIFIDSFPSADDPSCNDGTCAAIDAIVAANESLLGLAAGTIQFIGKLDAVSSPPVSGPLTGGESPFDVTPVTGSWVCDAAGCTLTIDFSAITADWQIVKILAKDGKDISLGDFLTDALLAGPLDNIQHAFISTQEIQDWCNDNPEFNEGQCTFGKFSHLLVFGVNTEGVPEPGTLMLLGLGIVGLGLTARRRLGL